MHEKIELLNERIERESCADTKNYDCVDFDNNPTKGVLSKKCELPVHFWFYFLRIKISVYHLV